MGFNIETGVSAFTVFLQGLLSFFSPCVFPLVPLYISYFAGGAKTVDENGVIHYPRKKVLLHTLFFVLGVSATFFILGFGFTALGKFFSDNRIWFARISGIVMIVFGLYQFGVFGRSMALEREHRLPFNLSKFDMGPMAAFILGFTFSFAWTPCVGPTLGSVLLMAGSSSSAGKAFMLIGVYTLGFVIPFMAVGLFTGTVLEFFKKHNNVVKYTVKIGAALLIIMGVMTLTGFMNGITGYLSGNTDQQIQQETENPPETQAPESGESEERPEIPAPDFTLTDQYGNSHKLSDYKGKTVFLNFWATWCSPCQRELPDIQRIYNEYGENKEDVVILSIVGPGIGHEGSEEEIIDFAEDRGITYPVLMDKGGVNFGSFGIRAFPTTFMIDTNGNVYGYVESALTIDIMRDIIDETVAYTK